MYQSLVGGMVQFVDEKRETAMTEAEAALRAALLDTLIELGHRMLSSVEGPETVARLYEKQAKRAHPMVADVLREAAERLAR